jgi:nitric oxide reductase NorD protein
MEWDQFIFKKIADIVAKIKQQPPLPFETENTVTLESIKARLTYLAQMLCGAKINICAAEHIGGWKGDTFFLPEAYSRGLDKDKNENFYIFRIFYMYGQFALRHFWENCAVKTEQESIAQAQLKAEEIIAFLEKEYPQFGAMLQSVAQAEVAYQDARNKNKAATMEWVHGKWFIFSTEDKAKLSELLSPVSKNTVADDKEKDAYTELKGKNAEQVEVLEVDTKAQEEYTLTHNFEKIETLDEFTGRWRNFDGSDELDEHNEALQELNMRQVVRVDSPVHSIYTSDFVHSMGLLDTDAAIQHWHFSYPEWQHHKKNYRNDYCKIIYEKQFEADIDYARNVLKERKREIISLKKKSEQYLHECYDKKREYDGDEPDLDAVVDAYVDLRTGNVPSEKVYVSKRKKPRDIAILVLVDSSLSADGYIDNRRILDIEKEALLIAGEVWSNFNLLFQIDTFASHTHSQCFYKTVKAFHEGWPEAKGRVGGIKSMGYTRIGAALRHATHVLNNVTSEKKWLLLLSDGKPNDYDTYEGAYGIQDVRKACLEAHQKDISLSAIAIDSNAKFYFPKMFGTGGYHVLNHTAQLPELLTKLYIKLLR